MAKSIFFALFFLAFLPGRAQTIHSIIFVNTFDEKIGSACLSDKDHVMLEMRTISRVLGYQLKDYIYIDHDFSVQKMNDCLGSLGCNPNDIVFFYFSGHGARAANDVSQWPQLNLNPDGENSDGNYFPLENVDRLLAKKRPRLRIVFGDCCNNTSKAVSPKLINKGQTVVQELDTPDKVYSSLFGECAGNVLASSSSQGEFSLALEDQGGLFTTSYFRSVEKALSGDIQPNWNSVMNTAKALTKEFVVEKNTSSQTPQFIVNVTSKDTPPEPPKPVNGDYLSLLESILDKSLSPGKRIQMIAQVHGNVFASDAVVETVGKDLKTVLDRELSMNFVKRMATSAFIVNLNEVVVKKDGAGKVTFLRVHETRKQ